MNYKTIGIIGGMSSLATVEFFRKIIIRTKATCDAEHVHVYVDNNTEIPDRSAAILNQGESPLNQLIKSARKLELIGADVLVMPCNTAHYYYNHIEQAVSIPFINMVKETSTSLKNEKHIKRVGLIATTGTLESGIYDEYLYQNGLEVIKPNDEAQKCIMQLIYAIKSGEYNYPLNDFLMIIRQLKKEKIQKIIIGCTEISLVLSRFIDEGNFDEGDFVDATDVLVETVIKFVGKEIRSPNSISIVHI